LPKWMIIWYYYNNEKREHMKLTLRARYAVVILSAILFMLALLTGAVLIQSRAAMDRVIGAGAEMIEEKAKAHGAEEMKRDLAAIAKMGMRQNATTIAVIALALSVLGAVVSVAAAAWLSRPIDALSSFTTRVKKGEYEVAFPAGSSDELGELGRTFNRMSVDLKETTFSRNFLNNILRSMVDPLIVADSKQTIMMVNRATSYLLGYKSEEELIGQPLETVFSQVIKESREAKRLIRLINQGIMYYETSLQAKRGWEIPVLISGSSIRDGAGNVLWTICTAVDISRRKEAEKRLQKAYAQLKETQNQLIHAAKMDAIGRMASGIAHEVKNPLGVILQGINCLEMRLPPGQKEIFDILRKIKNNVDRADVIIRGLLDFSKLTDLKREAVNINEIIENTMALIYHRVKLETIEVAKDLKEDMPRVMVDKRKMEQVFVNLLLNAVQAMPRGGRLSIRSRAVALEDDSAPAVKNTDGYFAKGETVVVAEVEDTGSGISPENMKKIFDPFFTTKESQDGTGLGLSVTRNIVDMHKGYLRIESEEGKGTRATVTLKTT